MASLKDIAHDYRRSAQLLTDRVSELSKLDTKELCMMELFRHRKKINALKNISREMLSTAKMLEDYYN